MRGRGQEEKIIFRRIVDIHSHVLPGLDDGAQDMKEALEMLRTAANEGIMDIIATPHCKRWRQSASPETILQQLGKLQKEASSHGIPIHLYPGNEVFYYNEMDELLESGNFFTMNKSPYVLVEFEPLVPFQNMQNGFDSIMYLGYRPILAHAERYDCLIKNKEHVKYICDMGIQIQINASSVVGKNGLGEKRFTDYLLKNEMVDYVGTDAHNNRGRAPLIRKCLDMVVRKYGRDLADKVFFENADKLITSA